MMTTAPVRLGGVRSRLPAALVAAVVALAALTGCGTSGAPSEQDASLVLDFTPNAVHAGIYTALARDYDDGEGIVLRVRTPPAAGGLRLLTAGRADLAVLSITDLALARERGIDVVGVMALVQRPLAAVIARPGVRSPRGLEGRRVGVAGLPSDDAVLRSVVAGAGGDPARVRPVTIGFNAVPALAGGRVDAVTGFWNDEGRTLRARLPGARVFRVDAFGAPPYPELVLCATRATLDERPSLVAGTVAALRRGYEEALRDPESAVLALTDRVRALERAPTLAALQAVAPVFTAGVPRPGVLDPERLRAWARWTARFGLTERPPDPVQAFVTEYANGGR
jgi:ABC-type nitrate/sulfonate/bicarbonate transport system substrate-binding protein